MYIYIYIIHAPFYPYMCAPFHRSNAFIWAVDREDLIKRHLSMLVGAPEADSMRSVEIWLWLNQLWHLWFMVDMTLYDYKPIFLPTFTSLAPSFFSEHNSLHRSLVDGTKLMLDVHSRKPVYLMVKTHGFPVKIVPRKPIHWFKLPKAAFQLEHWQFDRLTWTGWECREAPKNSGFPTEQPQCGAPVR